MSSISIDPGSTIQCCPEEEKSPYFIISRHVIEYPSASPTAKGYFAMYKSGCIEWHDIPQEFRIEINSIPVCDGEVEL